MNELTVRAVRPFDVVGWVQLNDVESDDSTLSPHLSLKRPFSRN